MHKYENFIGKVLDNRYKILELVGQGGMAFVLKAEDLVMNRIVAIKILNDEFNGNEQAETRFINESKAVAMLSHKNIVSIYDVAIYPDMKYIVMEFLDGITLREYLDNKGALPWKEACIYILQILRALEHAHSKGVIHRDIKPQNVILQKNGEIKVTDFGIAKLPNTPSLTQTEKAIGTVYYISPEQASGKQTDYYSDIYAVGIMLYEAVTGKLPFNAESTLSIAMMQVSQTPQIPKNIVKSLPEGVSQVILKAMEKEPGSRFTSAHTMCKAIEWVLRNPDVVFKLGSGSNQDSKTNSNSVSIDMIDTGEIQDYGDTEIAEALGKKNKKKTKNKKEKKEKEAKKSRSMFPIITGVSLAFLLVAIVLGVIFLISIIPSGNGGDEATYPNLIGKTWDTQLDSDLKNGVYGGKRFWIDKEIITYKENDDYKSGQIIEQEPPPNHVSTKPSNDSDIYYRFSSITVCRKLEDLTVPDITYFTSNEAKMILQNEVFQLQIAIEHESNNNFFDGQVIRTEPSAGSFIKPGDTIAVYICERIQTDLTEAMPNLEGLTKTQAENIIKYTGYDYEFIEIPSLEGNDKVITQSIEPGVVSNSNTKVLIEISLKQDGIPMPNLVGKTYSQAIEIIAGIKYLKINDYNSFYILEGDNLYKFIIKDLGYQEAVSELINFGYESAPDDNKSKVIYQSIEPETVIDSDIEISLIFGLEA